MSYHLWHTTLFYFPLINLCFGTVGCDPEWVRTGIAPSAPRDAKLGGTGRVIRFIEGLSVLVS